MRAVIVGKYGGPEVLTVAEQPDPEPGPGHVVVKLAAAGVNYIDTYQRAGVGAYRGQPLPFVVGSEGAGTVTAVGADVTDIAAGDRVAWTGAGNGYAEFVAVPADRVVPVPAGIDLRVAAAVMLQGMTAHYLTTSTFEVKEGNVAVVHAAAGGVGLLLTQMIRRRGGIVVGTTSTSAKAELALGAGANYVTGYDEFREAVLRVTGERGADVVYDGVGKATFDESLASLRTRGMMVLYGGSSGQVPPMDVQRLNSGGSLFLTRPTLWHHIADRAELLWRAGDVFAWIAAGDLDIRIGASYPLDEASRAHADLQGRRSTGKLLLIP